MTDTTQATTPRDEFDALLAAAREVPVNAQLDAGAPSNFPDEFEREALAFCLQGDSPHLVARLRPELLSPVAANLLVRLREARIQGLELRPSVLHLQAAELQLFTALTAISPVRPDTFTHHLELLLERRRQQTLAYIYTDLKDQVEGSPEAAVPPVPVDAALLAAMRRLESAVTEHFRDRDPSLAGYDFLAAYRLRPDRRPTRFPALNRLMIGGFYSGSMFLLSGEAGSGKTAFILNLAADYARDGHRVVFFSLEMEDYEIASRLLAYLSKETVQLSALVNRKVPETALAAILTENQQVFSNFIVEQMLAETSVHDLASTIYAHNLTRPQGSKELVVVIDPFQRLNAGDPDTDRDDISRTRAIAKEIKSLTNRLGLITLCTSDTTKEGTSRGGQTAIRGSYEAVHIATTTAHLELAVDQPEETDRRNLTLTITKNRGGLPRGDLSLSFLGETQRFNEMEQSKEE